jgi:hypothetical protein
MSRLTFATLAATLLFCLLCSGKLSAQTVCDQGNGRLDPAQPAGITPAEIIQKFTAKETIFKAARERYGYTLNVSVQTLDNFGRVDGEYRQISQIALNDEGKRTETTTFAPMNTLRRLSLTEDDLDDFRERLPFMLTPEDLPHYSVTYAGQQHVDEINTFVFDVAPQNEKKEKKAFEGRIWVDDRDFMIVKSCGKPREDENAKSTKKNASVNLAPLFVTYREEIDRQYWFPTYAKADEFLRFPRGLVHVREIVKYSSYKPLSPK